jgi:hypothetical protein
MKTIMRSRIVAALSFVIIFTIATSQNIRAQDVISYQAALHQEKQYTSFNSGWGYGPGWRGYGGSSMTTAQTSTIQIGGVDLDMYDVAKKQLVWVGTASKVNLEKAVAKLLKNYPPPQKNK